MLARTDEEPDAKAMTELMLQLMRGVNGQAFRLWGNRVMTGPFTGMIIPERTPWNDGNASTKLVGCYEHELHGPIEHAIWRGAKVAINVGCAEGYYAVGLARRGLEVYALDISEESRFVCEDYAAQNGTKFHIVDGALTAGELEFLDVWGHRLYLVDVEGAEDVLINPVCCPVLRTSDIIVECHDFLKPGVSSRLADRLGETHKVELIRPRLPDMRFLEKMPTALGVLTVVEKRPMPCYWLACWANQKGVSDG